MLSRCPTCETPHHTECWDWAGGCAIFGCRTLPVVAGRAPPAPLPVLAADRLSLTTNVAERVFDGDWDSLVEAYRTIPRSVTPWWWIWNTATLAGLTAAVIALAVVTGLSELVFRLIIEIGLRAFPIVGPLIAGLVFLPLALLKAQWRFLPDSREIEQHLSLAGITVFRRQLSFDEVLRVELRESGRLAKLVLLRADGGSVDLSHMQGSGLERAANLAALARGLQQHTTLHVTPELRADPVAMHKRLETLKLAAGEAAPRSAAVTRASLIPLTVALGSLSAWLFIAGALPAATVAAWLAGSAVVWPVLTRATSEWSLEENRGGVLAFLLVAAATALFIEVGTVAAPLLVVSMLAGAAGAAVRNTFDHAPLSGAGAGLLPAHLPGLEQELLGRHPERRATSFATTGYAVLAGLIALLVAAVAWFELGVVVASLVAFIPALGAALEAVAWTRARALDRMVARAGVAPVELTERAGSHQLPEA